MKSLTVGGRPFTVRASSVIVETRNGVEGSSGCYDIADQRSDSSPTLALEYHPVPFRLLLASACAALVSLGAIPVLAGAQTAGTPAATPVPSILLAPSGTAQAFEAFASTWAGVTAYSTMVTVSEISERKGTQIQTAVYDYTFRKPS